LSGGFRDRIRGLCIFRRRSPLRFGARELVRDMWRIYIARGVILAALIVLSGARHYLWVSLIALEFILWAKTYKVRAHEANIFRLTADERLYELAPGITYGYYFPARNIYGKDWVRPVKIGPLGLRVPEEGEQAPLSRDGLLVVGDSATFGEGVPFRDAYPAVIERELNKDASCHEHISVINAGVPGYNTVQAVASLPRLLSTFSPKVVILAVTLEDTLVWGPIEIGRDGEMVRLNAPARQKPREWLKRLSYILYDLSQVYRFWRMEGYLRDLFSDDYIGYRAWMDAVHRMGALCRSSSAIPIVVIIPALLKLESYVWRGVHARITDVCEDEGIYVIDPLPVVEGYRSRSLWVHPTDPHPSVETHGMIGREIASRLATFLDLSSCNIRPDEGLR